MLWTDRHGKIVLPEIVDALKVWEGVWVLLWAFNRDAWNLAFVRELDTSESQIRREPFVARERVFVLISSNKTHLPVSPHGRWIRYHSPVSESRLFGAHPECERCNGTGITPYGKKGVYNEKLCSCIDRDYYWVLVSGRWIVIYNKPSRQKAVVRR